MALLDKIKVTLTERQASIANSLILGSILLYIGMPLAAGVTALFIGSGAANIVANYLNRRMSNLRRA